jgi:hypothetical protein
MVRGQPLGSTSIPISVPQVALFEQVDQYPNTPDGLANARPAPPVDAWLVRAVTMARR